MDSFNTTILKSIEVFHPEFTGGIAEIEIEFEIDVYYEPEDRSVGIFGDNFIAESYKITEITLHDGDKKYKISEAIAEQLVPEDEWERLAATAKEDAESLDQDFGSYDDY